jgi:hypothetical protein
MEGGNQMRVEGQQQRPDSQNGKATEKREGDLVNAFGSVVSQSFPDDSADYLGQDCTRKSE